MYLQMWRNMLPHTFSMAYLSQKRILKYVYVSMRNAKFHMDNSYMCMYVHVYVALVLIPTIIVHSKPIHIHVRKLYMHT